MLGVGTAAHAQAGDPVPPPDDSSFVGKGRVIVELRSRYFPIPGDVVPGLTLQPTITVRWTPLARLRLAIDAQTVDNQGPGRQGPFRVSRMLDDESSGRGNYPQEIAVAADVRLWRRSPVALWLGGTVSTGNRSYRFVDSLGASVSSQNRREVVSTIEPRIALDGRWGMVSVGAVTAWYPGDNVLYYRQLPTLTGETFGTATFATAHAGIALGSRWVLDGRVGIPLSGRNTVVRETGLAEAIPVFDAGLVFRVHQGLALRAFASNALGNSGALALVADREYVAVGGGIEVVPGRSSFLSRQRFRQAGRDVRAPSGTGTLIAPWFADISGSGFRTSFAASGIHASFGGPLVPGLTTVLYLDHTRGVRDEGELGAMGAVRLIAQAEGSPADVGVLVSASVSNNVLVNLLSGQADEFVLRGFERSGYDFGGERIDDGRAYLLTAAIPLSRRTEGGSRLWMTPVVSGIQRRGIEVSGLALGLDSEPARALGGSIALGIPIGAHGNVLHDDSRDRAVAWHTAAHWRFRNRPLVASVFMTNRVGDSPFHSLRVRADGRLALGLGAGMVFR
jgi:hypothetical protein